MAIKTRQTDGTGVTNENAPLTNGELDNNFIELVAEDALKANLSGANFTGNITNTGTITAGAGATTGGRSFAQTYSGNDILGNLSSLRSTGAFVFGYGVTGDGSTANQYNSSYDNFNGGHSAVTVNQEAIQFLNDSSDSQTTVGSEVPNFGVRVQIDRDGLKIQSRLLNSQGARLHNEPASGLRGTGMNMTDLGAIDTGANFANDGCRGLVWTGKHYIFIDADNARPTFHFYNSDLTAGKFKNGSATIDHNETDLFHPHGAAWDGRYIAVIGANAASGAVNNQLHILDLDNLTSGYATRIAKIDLSPIVGATNNYGVGYAEGLYWLRTGTNLWGIEVDLASQTATAVVTKTGIASSITGQAITYDGSHLYITQNGQPVFKHSLDGALVASQATGNIPNCTALTWNGQEFIGVQYNTGDIWAIPVTHESYSIHQVGELNVNEKIGTRENSLSVSTPNSSSPAVFKANKTTAFGILPWSNGYTYLSSGTYYDDDTWVHASDNTSSSLLEISGTSGARWYASSNSNASWNLASAAPLWNSSAQITASIRSPDTAEIGNTSEREWLEIKSSQWPEIRLTSSTDTGGIRWGMTHETNSNYRVTIADGYIYGADTNSMLLIIPQDGSSLKRQAAYNTDPYTIWDSNNHGAGSTLDADYVDGFNAFAINSPNYASTSSWAVGTGNQNATYGSNFTLNGDSSENNLAWGEDPFGRRGLLWRAQNNDGSSNADGGWNKTINDISGDKSYMSYVYVKRVGSNTSGTFYFGCSGGHTSDLNNVANGNPYFVVRNLADLPQDVWCLAVGFIQANGDTNNVNLDVGGIYRMDTGERLQASNIFKMRYSGSTAQVHRAYLYYSTSSAAELNWWGAGFYEINGQEPRLEDLLGNQPLNATINGGITIDGGSQGLQVKESNTRGAIRLGGGNGTDNHRLYFQADATNAYIDSYGGDAYNPLTIQASPLNLNTSGGAITTGSGTFTFNGGNNSSYGPIITSTSNGGPAIKLDSNGTSGKELWLISNSTSNSDGAGRFQFWNHSDSRTFATFAANAGERTKLYNPVEIAHTNLSAEPFSGLHIINTNAASGAAYTGVYIDAPLQSHVRLATAGALKWQMRTGPTTTSGELRFYSWDSSADVFRLASNGNATLTGELTVNSDERIKDNIKQIDGALEKVQAIRGVTFTRNDTDDDRTHVGVIAQEVEKVLPEVVTESEETGIKSVAYANMVGLLIEAIKEQQTQIDDLKAEVTRLKGFE